jgi:hypothetical protein
MVSGRSWDGPGPDQLQADNGEVGSVMGGQRCFVGHG